MNNTAYYYKLASTKKVDSVVDHESRTIRLKTYGNPESIT